MSEGCLFALGRYQPLTKGHEKVLRNMINLARNQNKTPIIYVSKGIYKSRADKVKNPFTQNERMGMMKAIFPNVNVRAQVNNPIATANSLNKPVSICVGSNRVDAFQKMMTKYGHGVVSAGTRRNNTNGISGVSGTKLRKWALNNNYTQYRNWVPRGFTNNQVREQMKIIQERLPAPAPSRKRKA
jgi:hypothetical protein